MLLGTGIFGYMLTVMTHTLSDSFSTDGQVSIKFKALQQFMEAKELPFELRVRGAGCRVQGERSRVQGAG